MVCDMHVLLTDFSGTNEEDTCLDSLCYYCLISREVDELDALLGETDQGSQEFIVCLITPNDFMLDLYPFFTLKAIDINS